MMYQYERYIDEVCFKIKSLYYLICCSSFVVVHNNFVFCEVFADGRLLIYKNKSVHSFHPSLSASFGYGKPTMNKEIKSIYYIGVTASMKILERE